ncbi:MAG: DUF6079 family protein [Armatimonadota bacterium]|jgi:energy-coupling factor transporter ATP-binding protein EcfA2
MKYDDLFRFEPIETVIQLTEADSAERAMHLVDTFVISDRMAEQLSDLVIPNLQFDEPADNKGLLVVGNYGTGKSHLMSVISAIAEHEDAVEALTNPEVAEAAEHISGRFKVIRTEIGSSEMRLRNIVCNQLSAHLQEMGVEYTFPPMDEVTNNKDDLQKMMAQFAEKYPDHGLLLIVDELLDYLRSRNDQDLVLDLNFLRELGEVCSSVRLRFMAGLQEALVDNPKWAHVADSLSWVMDRYQQLRIVREDVAFVVSERLLKKDDEQRARIREHLTSFAPLYENMAERMDEYVRLFPVHPTYLAVFEELTIAEKREVLRTLSGQMRKLVGEDVPLGEPGLLSYDSYWEVLRENKIRHAVPEIREVFDKSEVLVDRVEHALTQPKYKDMAHRICRALAVQRLGTDDIYAPIGVTAAELKDGLCLYHSELPEQESGFLQTTVETTLREIVKTMSGQYISHNEDNQQYFLDLKKDIDYEAKIAERAETVGPGQLDRFYFDALTRVMECHDTPSYVTGYRIWEHEVPWLDHGITRRGYLFFGAPNERSTAQPPRDFYIYFLQPHKPPKYEDEERADEVFFDLKNRDDEFNQALRLYAGARLMAQESSSSQQYESKADEHLRTITKWLRDNMLTAFEVTHQGVSQSVVEALEGQRTGNLAVRDLVNEVAAIYLAPAFEERYPDYPSFTTAITASNVDQAAGDAIRFLAGGQATQMATAVLQGLELMDDGKLRPNQSRYAKPILKKLDKLENKEVINRKDLLVTEQSVTREGAHQLEPELFAVVLVAMVYSGDIVLSIGSGKIDSGNMEELRKTKLEDIAQFRHIEKPRGVPVPALCALMEFLGLQPGLMKNPDTRDEAIKAMQPRVKEMVEDVVAAKQKLRTGYQWWGAPLVDEAEQEEYRKDLDALQEFLEKLQPFNTPGKLRNFPFSIADIEKQEDRSQALSDLHALDALLDDVGQLASYFETAEQVLPEEDPWNEEVAAAREDWRAKMRDPVVRTDDGFRHEVRQALRAVKQDYIDRYASLHQRARLGINDDEKKQKLMNDPLLQDLKRLVTINLLPRGELSKRQNELTSLKSCFQFTDSDIESRPVCPHCNFRPAQEEVRGNASTILSQMGDQFERLAEEWTQTLLENLEDPTAQQSIELLSDDEQEAVEQFMEAKELPQPVSNEFVQGVQRALEGLEPVTVTAEELVETLGVNRPMTVEQFRKQFDSFVQGVAQGKDIDRLRIVIREGEQDAES